VSFSRLSENISLRGLNAAWTTAKANLEKNKKSFKNFDTSDLTAYAAAADMRILAKWLLESKDIDKTGRYFGFLGGVGVNLFGDLDIATSGASKRIQQIIKRMRAGYRTLASATGDRGRDSVFAQKIQTRLLPAFTKTKNMNRRDLETIVSRLDLILKAPFSPAVQGNYVIPQSMVEAARESGIEDVKINLRKYPWIDPRVKFMPLVERREVLGSLGIEPWDVRDALEMKKGEDFPKDGDGNTWRKISKTKIQQVRAGKLVPNVIYEIKDIKAFQTAAQKALYDAWMQEHKDRKGDD
jgi:hypothetical protein